MKKERTYRLTLQTLNEYQESAFQNASELRVGKGDGLERGRFHFSLWRLEINRTVPFYLLTDSDSEKCRYLNLGWAKQQRSQCEIIEGRTPVGFHLNKGYFGGIQ